MLKDRRVLLEKEITSLKKACGQLYLRIVSGNSDTKAHDSRMYDGMKMKLADMTTELLIIDQMIADGHP